MRIWSTKSLARAASKPPVIAATGVYPGCSPHRPEIASRKFGSVGGRTGRWGLGRLGAARDDADGCEGVNSFALLIIRGPFDQRDALRLCPRWREADNFTLEMENVAGPYRHHPPQLVDAEPYQRMRTERPDLNGEVHRYRSGMPARGRETFEWSIGSSCFVEVHRLWIIF